MLAILKSPLSHCAQLINHIIKKLKLIPNAPACERFLNQLPSNVKTPVVLSYINAHAFNLMQLDEIFCHDLLASDILLRDGVGLEIMLKLYKVDPGVNMNGTDLNPKIIQQFLGKKIALCGTSDTRLAEASKKLTQKGHSIALTVDGFQSKEVYLQAIQSAMPELILLGMGMPKQEHVAIYLKQQLNYPCLIVNVGAALDYIAGAVPRAPRWVRKLRLEWLYRMLAEPKRLWKRYVLGNPIFLLRVLCARFLSKH